MRYIPAVRKPSLSLTAVLANERDLWTIISVQTKQDFLFRPNTNIRPSKLSEYSAEYEYSENIRFWPNIRVFTEHSAILPNIRPFYRIFGQ